MKAKLQIPTGQSREDGGIKHYEDILYILDSSKKAAQKRNYIYLGIIILCIAANLYISLTAHFKTYVVRIDNATGRIETTGPLQATNYSPAVAEFKYFLISFITKIRTIPMDPIVYRKNWSDAQYFLMPAAAKKLNFITEQEGQIDKLGKYTSQITITSIQQQPGVNSSFQVRWFEDIYGLASGTVESRNHYIAILTLELIPPTDEEDLVINPLGIKIHDLNFTRETLK